MAQVGLRWLTQRGIVAIPKSTHIERMRQNFEIFDFSLSMEEMSRIEGLNQQESPYDWYRTPGAVHMFLDYDKNHNPARQA